ncbi:hypothetical protein [Microcella humidisoli]|jgi:hypothetical protein|uniref:Uncharacterized protein n=1 Tax=Microcella humidisoli TaxID=2963406 RepID=A0ABY5FY50_9MICO|nr:hypothetical protein [Microcella humidisoli]UTT63224.1 hypothetical protein NNL39_03710 [Microcella humidisoli]
MRFWPASASATAVPLPPAGPRDLAHQIEEGYLVALSALRLSVKNGVILRILRDGAAWDEAESAALARHAIDALAAELRETAARLSDDSAQAAPTARESRGARSKRDLARVRRKRDEAARLAARSRTLRGVVELLEAARDDETVVRDLALRARDDTIGELMQARLIPRGEPVLLTEEEQREAIAGVKDDLQRLIDERTGY